MVINVLHIDTFLQLMEYDCYFLFCAHLEIQTALLHIMARHWTFSLTKILTKQMNIQAAKNVGVNSSRL